MTAGKRAPRGEAVALIGALVAYEKWVANLVRPGGSWGGDAHIGHRQLQKLLEIRRTSFPDLKDEATALLLAHAGIAHVLYQQELRALRGTESRPVDDHDRCAALTDRQLMVIEALRRAVASKVSIHSRESRHRRRWY